MKLTPSPDSIEAMKLSFLGYIKSTIIRAREHNGEELFKCEICGYEEKMEWKDGMHNYYFTVSPMKLSWCCSDTCKTAFLLQQEIYEGCFTEKK